MLARLLIAGCGEEGDPQGIDDDVEESDRGASAHTDEHEHGDAAAHDAKVAEGGPASDAKVPPTDAGAHADAAAHTTDAASSGAPNHDAMGNGYTCGGGATGEVRETTRRLSNTESQSGGLGITDDRDVGSSVEEPVGRHSIDGQW